MSSVEIRLPCPKKNHSTRTHCQYMNESNSVSRRVPLKGFVNKSARFDIVSSFAILIIPEATASLHMW